MSVVPIDCDTGDMKMKDNHSSECLVIICHCVWVEDQHKKGSIKCESDEKLKHQEAWVVMSPLPEDH
jgi:hypothetical protein